MSTATSSSIRFAFLVLFAGGFLDSYTYLARGGVFATAQTGNVVLAAVEIGQRDWSAALARVWPIVAFVAGIAGALHIRAGRLDDLVHRPIRWTIGVQAVLVAIVGFVPATAPHALVTIPIAFVAGVQVELFRDVAGQKYMAIATTGNLMRLVESIHGALTSPDSDSGRVLRIHAGVVASFIGGALLGGLITQLLGVHAAWVVAAVMAVTLLLFLWDDHKS